METHPDMEDSEDDSRHYTLDDAIELLPAVRDVVEKVQQIWLTAGAERRAFEVLQTSRKTPIEISLAHQSLVAALWDVQPLVEQPDASRMHVQWQRFIRPFKMQFKLEFFENFVRNDPKFVFL